MDRSTRASKVALIFVLLISVLSIESKRRISTEDIIKTHNSDIYDCVDFYKQPAFDHPLLANHTFHHEMKPAPIPEMTRFKTEVSVNHTEVQFKGIGCPVGTVPIRRVAESERIRQSFNSIQYGSKYMPPGTHYAAFRTKLYGPRKYYGGGAGISIWNPSIRRDQSSSGELVIRNGNDNIQVGWTVNQELYADDSRTRLFVYTGAGRSQCYNTFCPGFVLTNKDVAIDEVFKGSTRGGPTYYIRLFIYKETPGHWWLRAGPSLNAIGFWPSYIFTSLADTAENVIWGGHVAGPPDKLAPPMGSGEYLIKDTDYDAYCKEVQIVSGEHEIVDATEDVEAFADNSHYQVEYLGVQGRNFGNLVLFGGPGNMIVTQ